MKYFSVARFNYHLSVLQEHHLQRALSAQQVYGTAEALVIPIPEIDDILPTYKRLYEPEGGYRPTRQYIHVQRKIFAGCC